MPTCHRSDRIRRVSVASLALFIFSLSYADLIPIGSAQVASPRPDWQIPRDSFVTVRGHRVQYVERGSGPTLLLLHGFSGSAAFEWGRVIADLAQTHRVVAPQLPGFAPSDVPEMRYDENAFVEHLAELIHALRLDRVVLIGESFGGWVAANYAIRAAEVGSAVPSVDGLVLVGAAIGLRHLDPGARGFADTVALAEARAFAATQPRRDHEATRQRIIQDSGFLRGLPSDEQLARIKVPTLLIWGEQDDLVPLAIGQHLARTIPGAQLATIPDAGHIPAVERPAEFMALVRGFR
ncbi:MAG: alpha/beta hydrolase [Gemmatimonadales bacterium]|nr:alpha/beta hydrolase [Gemmatimonadales bacterium]